MSSRRVRDKWRLKTWVTVYAPPYFGGHGIALVPITDPGKAVGRVVEVTLYDIAKQNISHMNIKMYFQIVKVEDARAETIFKGHEYAREYLRSLVRRGSSRIDGIFNAVTKDGFKVRIYAVAFSRKRLKPSQESAIRKIMERIVIERTKNLTYEQLAHEVVLGKLASDIYNDATKIAPLRHVGIRKSKLLAQPQQIFSPSQPQPA